MGNRKLTYTEFSVAAALIGLVALLILHMFANTYANHMRYSCQQNLKAFGTVFRMYMEESEGEFLPPPAPYADIGEGGWSNLIWSAPKGITIYPDYLNDLEIARCPSDGLQYPYAKDLSPRLPRDGGTYDTWQTKALSEGDTVSYDYFLSAELAQSYLYTGYLMFDSPAYYGYCGASTAIDDGVDVDIMGVGALGAKKLNDDLPIDGSRWPPWVPSPPEAVGFDNRQSILRLRSGMQRFFITDGSRWYWNQGKKPMVPSSSSAPVMWDAFGRNDPAESDPGPVLFNHKPNGGNILFLDGHVEYMRYGETFPIIDNPTTVDLYTRYGVR
ncbi:MAG: hypothetical protein KF886_12310 [Candidatus Hydrogenedentes bacterium]|nr:hypothetical protein [Candidatus Hydrogenedentota bacterium]